MVVHRRLQSEDARTPPDAFTLPLRLLFQSPAFGAFPHRLSDGSRQEPDRDSGKLACFWLDATEHCMCVPFLRNMGRYYCTFTRRETLNLRMDFFSYVSGIAELLLPVPKS